MNKPSILCSSLKHCLNATRTGARALSQLSSALFSNAGDSWWVWQVSALETLGDVYCLMEGCCKLATTHVCCNKKNEWIQALMVQPHPSLLWQHLGCHRAPSAAPWVASVTSQNFSREINTNFSGTSSACTVSYCSRTEWVMGQDDRKSYWSSWGQRKFMSLQLAPWIKMSSQPAGLE